MAGRAVLFAVTPDQVSELLHLNPDDRADHVGSVIEEEWEEPFVCELDKAWDALQRCLTDGTLDGGAGTFPRNAIIIGKDLVEAGEFMYLGLVDAALVPEVAAAAASVTQTDLRTAYANLDPRDYGPEHGDEDLDYVLGIWRDVPSFYARAVDGGRAVLFSVDQ